MDAWTDQLIMGGNGDGNLLYPGTQEKVGGRTFIPIASIRLKQLRDGMEDNEYLHLLEAAEGGGTAMQSACANVWHEFSPETPPRCPVIVACKWLLAEITGDDSAHEGKEGRSKAIALLGAVVTNAFT